MTDNLRRWCKRVARIVGGICGAVAVCILASSSDVASGLDLDQVRLLASRIFQWVRKEGA
jgi:hypothetical protein